MQRLSDQLILATRKEVINGADWGTATRDNLLDAGTGETAFTEQSFRGIKHPRTTSG